MTAWWLVLRRVAGDLLVAQFGGVLLLALATAVEAGPGQLLVRLGERVPSGWALAAAVLTCLGTALGAARMRRGGLVLGLGTLGAGPARIVVVATVLGGAIGAGASTVVHEPALVGGWERGVGGWMHEGTAYPDVVDGEVQPVPHVAVPVVPPLAALPGGAAAGALGATLGLYDGAAAPVVVGALLLVGEAVTAGLVERGSLPTVARLVPGLVLALVAVGRRALAPLFPTR